MKGLTLSVTCLALLILGGCARHFVVERSAGRIDGEKSISTNSDTGWTVQHEPAPGKGARAEPPPARHSAAYRNVLSRGRAAPLRAEAARRLGELLADDEESVWVLSVATNDENPNVQQAARRALVRIFEARSPDRDDEQELGEVARAKAHQFGRGAIQIIRWLWNNIYFWPEFDVAAVRELLPLVRVVDDVDHLEGAPVS